MTWKNQTSTNCKHKFVQISIAMNVRLMGRTDFPMLFSKFGAGIILNRGVLWNEKENEEWLKIEIEDEMKCIINEEKMRKSNYFPAVPSARRSIIVMVCWKSVVAIGNSNLYVYIYIKQKKTKKICQNNNVNVLYVSTLKMLLLMSTMEMLTTK